MKSRYEYPYRTSCNLRTDCTCSLNVSFASPNTRSVYRGLQARLSRALAGYVVLVTHTTGTHVIVSDTRAGVKPEAARIAVAVLSNLSMSRSTFPYFLPIEKDLLLVACSDRSVADVLTNVIADVYGMHAL